ncbi:hypothetical protein AURDEDRAFT_173422 [Auricularia subglabra TFB-10046 SS5]|nr:hypothetical protein AURDEDRAFT_173422 [Auricularia subglabra TFB-10046 SS5]
MSALATGKGPLRGRPPDGSALDDTLGWSELTPGPSTADTTVAPASALFAPTAHNTGGLTHEFDQAPQSTFVADYSISNDSPPARPSLLEPRSGSGSGSATTTGAPSSKPYDEDPNVSRFMAYARGRYSELVTLTGFDKNGQMVLSLDADLNDSTRLHKTMLAQRVEAIRRLATLTDDMLEYKDKVKRWRPHLKDAIVALFENVANNLQDLVYECYNMLPWPEYAPKPPLDWAVRCIPPVGETHYSAAEVGWYFCFTRDWIDCVAATIEIMLTTPSRALNGHFPPGSAGATATVGSALPGRPVAPVLATGGLKPDLSVLQSKKVVIKSPVQPSAPSFLQGTNPPTTANVYYALPDQTLREGVMRANETMALRADPFHLPTDSQGDVSRLLGLEQTTGIKTPRVPAISQYVTPATGGAYGFNTPAKPAAPHTGTLPPITPGQLGTPKAPAWGANGAPLLPQTPYGGGPPPDVYQLLASQR